MRVRSLSDWQKIRRVGRERLFSRPMRISVGYGSCGIAAGADAVLEAFRNDGALHNSDILVTKTGCLGFCGEEPLVNVSRPGLPMLVYRRVTENDVNEIITRSRANDVYQDKVFCRIEKAENYIDPEGIAFGTGFNQVPIIYDIPFYRKQKKVVLRESGLIDPENIDEYIAVGGYSSLLKVLKDHSPEDVIQIVKDSGLRGRGGAGFPTGLKWEFTRNNPGDKKYVICNADEGDPGAYMNRNEMESDPHMVLEGMIIGGYAMGSTEGIIYVRTEYPLAVQRLRRAIEQAQDYGFVGDRICNSDFSFNLHIVCGAGAFVCGEETALIASIEGFSGRSRPRPPFPAERGLFGKPTNVNNVETWSNVPVIIAQGAGWYARTGTAGSKGTKVFSLVGAVKNVGLVEVPLGITLKEVIHDLGGGGIKGKQIKAVQTGGPSGGCIPASLFDLPVDYESLQKSGAIMGSGGMVVMDERNCMVDVTKYFLSFTMEESCGKCIPCRRGLEHMHSILEDITEGKGEMEHIEELVEISSVVKEASLCGLGQTAPNPVLSTIRYFRDEYEAHIREHACPAGVCKALISYSIDADTCTGCHVCLRNCPTAAVSGKKKEVHIIDQEKCIKCGACFDSCKFDAVRIT